MKEYIDKTEEYLSELVNYLWEENWTMEKFLIIILGNIIGFSLFSIIKLFLEKIIFNDIRKTK